MSSWNPNDFRAATAPPIPARPFYPDDQDLALLLHSMQVNDHDDGALTVTLPTVHTPAEDIANNVIRRPAAEVEESYAGAATMFDTAEAENAERERLRQERNLAERRRRLWLQFVEGVVREVEMASDQRSQQLAPVAREIIDLRGLETFLEVRRLDGESARRILRTFPRLHTELVLRLGSFRPIPNISIESYLRVEHNLGQNVDFANLHAACWSIRLFERVIQESPAEAELGDEIFDVTTGARMVQGEDHGESFNHTGAIESLTRHSTRNLDGPTVRVPTSRSDSDTTVGILSADSGTFSEHGAALAGLRDDGLRAEEMRREREIEDCLGVEEAALGFGRSSERRVATRQRG